MTQPQTVDVYPPEPKLNVSVYGIPGDAYDLPAGAIQQINDKGGSLAGADGGSGAGGFLLDWGRFILEMGGGGGGQSAEHVGVETDAGIGYGTVAVGVIAVRKRFFRIFPFAGVGGSGGGITVTRAGEPEPVLSTGAGTGLFEIGLGADLLLPLGPVRLMLGARAGLAWVPPGDPNAPPIRESGPFFRVQVGAGSNR
jgi:hypothetical protein